MKKVEAGELNGFTFILNLMEIIFVLRRKKKWKDEKKISATGKISDIPHFSVLIPTESDMISAYSPQTTLKLDPFNSIYFAICRIRRVNYIVSTFSR